VSGFTLSKLARGLARAAVLVRDVNAVQRGRIVERLTNRVIGRLLGRATRGVWR
jgi:hypothetical protein